MIKNMNYEIKIKFKEDLFNFYFLVSSILHLWSWLWFFYKIEGLFQKYTLINSLSVFAYIQLFTFIESAIVFSIISTSGFLLTKRININKFLSQSTIIFLVTSIWIMVFYFLIKNPSFSITIWILSYFFILISLLLLSMKFNKIDLFFNKITTQFFALGLLFLISDILCISIVFLQNIL